MKTRHICRGIGYILSATLGMQIQLAEAQQSSGQPENEITFTSWTGPYMRSQMLGFVRPYEVENGVRVHVEHYNGGIEEIRDQVESANVVWDVVDLTQADSLRACNEGLLEKIDDIELPDGADGTPFAEDFVEGALNECGVGVIVWATAFAYRNDAFEGEAPATIADFFRRRQISWHARHSRRPDGDHGMGFDGRRRAA